MYPSESKNTARFWRLLRIVQTRTAPPARMLFWCKQKNMWEYLSQLKNFNYLCSQFI